MNYKNGYFRRDINDGGRYKIYVAGVNPLVAGTEILIQRRDEKPLFARITGEISRYDKGYFYECKIFGVYVEPRITLSQMIMEHASLQVTKPECEVDVDDLDDALGL